MKISALVPATLLALAVPGLATAHVVPNRYGALLVAGLGSIGFILRRKT